MNFIKSEHTEKQQFTLMFNQRRDKFRQEIRKANVKNIFESKRVNFYNLNLLESI